MNDRALPILGHAATLADLTRCRILQALGRQELTVSELCRVLQLPQSTVSRHLKVLSDGGWLKVRAQGTRNFYRLAGDELAGDARRLWRLVREQLTGTPADEEDARRLDSVVVERRAGSQAFFASAAARWDPLRQELFGRRFDLLALLCLCDRDWVVGDLACGTGQVAQALAPFVRQVIAVDGSPAMLAAARGRLRHATGVRLLEGPLEDLPLADAELDVATLVLALHHVPEPDRVLAEAKRVLKPGGRLLVADMMPHQREEYRREMGHVWLGFAEDEIERRLAGAGFVAVRYQPLPADPDARGPSLFVATATRPQSARRRHRPQAVAAGAAA